MAPSMKLLGNIFLIFALLTQTPLLVRGSVAGQDSVCMATCCCEAAPSSCACVDSEESPMSPPPANSPTTPGRELVPVTLWIADVPFLSLTPSADLPLPGVQGDRVEIPASVSRSVLFCSILI